jgi:hypothetical protein
MQLIPYPARHAEPVGDPSSVTPRSVTSLSVYVGVRVCSSSYPETEMIVDVHVRFVNRDHIAATRSCSDDLSGPNCFLVDGAPALQGRAFVCHRTCCRGSRSAVQCLVSIELFNHGGHAEVPKSTAAKKSSATCSRRVRMHRHPVVVPKGCQEPRCYVLADRLIGFSPTNYWTGKR